MPEIKHQFTGGKMNKDVDERLVPKGEYRDAMNIQVSTSEGSDVGTVQNILGNKEIILKPKGVANVIDTSGFSCVGVYSDEKTDSAYWFLTGPEISGKGGIPTAPGSYSKDYIIRISQFNASTGGNNVDIIFTDTKDIVSKAANWMGFDAISSVNNVINIPIGWTSELSVGDTLRTIVDSNGVFHSRNSKIISIKEGVNPGDLSYIILDKLKWPGNAGSGLFDLIFKSNCLNFQEGTHVTGINIIDDILLWTDNHNEPKMLNISRSKDYTHQQGLLHSKLYNPMIAGLHTFKKVEPHHMQVIKRKPTHALSTTITDLRRSGLVYGQLDFEFSNASGIMFSDGYQGTVTINSGNSNENLNYNQNDILLILNTADQSSTSSNRSLPEQYDVKMLIIDIVHYGSGVSVVDFEIISVANTTPFIFTTYTSRLMEVGATEFDEEMFRFSYRYRYLDGEVSGFAPWSNTVFVPGTFKYDQKNAYNFGMLNNVTDLNLDNFIDYEKTLNVVSFDLLVKNDNHPSVYLIDTVRRDKFPNSSSDTNGNPYGGTYKFNPNQIQATLPENQLLRPFDNVPRKALAQEISGNRLIYGNYLESYDYSSNSINLKPGVKIRPIEIQQPNDGAASVKTQRNYQVGMVLVDQEGRESPIITSEDASVEVPKGMLDVNTMLTVSNYSIMPNWVNSYKYYIKDSSNPAYNLVIDSFYKAETGDYWVSVPSSERNKIKEGDLIELKKGIDDNRPLLVPLRTKVIAIENEAPEFIKVNYRKLGRSPAEWPTTPIPNTIELFAIDGRPAPAKDHFKILKDRWMSENINTYGGGANLAGLDLAFTFTAADSSGTVIGNTHKTKLLTGKATHYEDPSGTVPPANSGTFVIRLDELIPDANDWMLDATNTNSGLNPTLDITIYEKEIIASAEYHGKFFMKLEAKQDLVDSIVPSDIVMTDEVILNQIPVRNFTDNDWFSGARTTNKGANDGLVMTTPIYNGDTAVYKSDGSGSGVMNVLDWGQNGRTDTYEKWSELLQHYFPYQAMGEQMPQYWFIDRMYYKRAQDLQDMTAPSIAGGSGHGRGIFKCTADQANLDNSATPSYNRSTTGVNLGWLEEGNWYMELSIVGMMKEIHHQQYAYAITFDIGDFANAGVNGSDSAWDIEYRREGYGPQFMGCNSSIDNSASWVDNQPNNDCYGGSHDIHDSTNQQVAMAFVPNAGTKFKWEGGTQVFTIMKHKFELRWNHTGPEAASGWHLDNTLSSGSYTSPPGIYGGGSWPAFFDPNNRRTTFILELDKDPSGDPNIDPTNKNQVSSYEPVNMIFLEQTLEIGPGDPVLSTNNPAIFEIPQKLESKLDIYHEASSEIPIELNYPNLSRLIPVGSTVRYPGDSTLLAESKVTSITQGFPSRIIIDNATPGPTALATWQNIVSSGDKISFLTPAGDTVNLALQAVYAGGYPNPILSPISSTLGSGFSMGLGWSNCISFRNGIESVFLKDDYNEIFLSKGVKVSSTLDKEYKETHNPSKLIFSGIFNSTSDVNNLNQFIVAEKITKDINPIYGSIQKLYSRSTADGDLITLCEDRVLKVLANKDALFNADGNAQLTSNQNVLGQAVPYAGEFGISKNPESFSAESYRAYFTDKVRGVVLRLSKDGLTPISNSGMKDWFRDNLQLYSTHMGAYDDKKDEYNLTLEMGGVPQTISYREDVKGWVSFKSFFQQAAVSCANEYYTYFNGGIYRHHDETPNTRNTFYGTDEVNYTNSSLQVVFNEVPGSVKSFKTINYEGSQARVTQPLINGVIYDDGEYFNLTGIRGWYVDTFATNLEHGSVTEFIEKEGKWFGYTIGSDVTLHSLTGAVTSNYDTSDSSIQGIGRLGSISSSVIFGCTCDGGIGFGQAPANDCYNPGGTAAWNYNSSATADDGSCIEAVFGCMDPSAFNFNNLANSDSGTCLWYGCMDATALNFDAQVNVDDGSCIIATPGCQVMGMFNYDSTSNVACGGVWLTSNDVGILSTPQPADYCCVGFIQGCTDPLASNFIALVDESVDVNTEDGTCQYFGCTNPIATNYDFPNSNPPVDSTANQYVYLNGTAVDDLSCNIPTGCMDNDAATNSGIACNYDATAVIDDGSCLYCGDILAVNYDGANAGCSVNSANCIMCQTPSNILLIGSTTSDVIGGVDQSNGSVTFEMDESGSSSVLAYLTDLNNNAYFDPNNTTGWGTGVIMFSFNNLPVGTSSVFINTLCESVLDPAVFNNVPSSTGITVTFTVTATPIPGCMDATACNYDVLADFDDGTCVDPVNCTGCTDNSYLDFCDTCYDNINYQAVTSGTGGPWLFGDMTLCTTLLFSGCTDPTMFNYDSSANTDCDNNIIGSADYISAGTYGDVSCCTLVSYGCLDSTLNTSGSSVVYAAGNYDSTANTPCDGGVPGCVVPNCTGPGTGSGQCCDDYNCPTGSIALNPGGTVDLNLNTANTPYQPWSLPNGSTFDIALVVTDNSGVVIYNNTDLAGMPGGAFGDYVWPYPNQTGITQQTGSIPQSELWSSSDVAGVTSLTIDYTIITTNGLCSIPYQQVYTVGCNDQNANNYGFYAINDVSACTYTGCTDSAMDHDGQAFAADNYLPLYTTMCGSNADNQCCDYQGKPYLDLQVCTTAGNENDICAYYMYPGVPHSFVSSITTTFGPSNPTTTFYAGPHQVAANANGIEYAGEFEEAAWLAFTDGNTLTVDLNSDWAVGLGVLNNPYVGSTNPLLLWNSNDPFVFTVGCRDGNSSHVNWDPNLDLHFPNSCVVGVSGCTDSTATNYDAAANQDCNATPIPPYGTGNDSDCCCYGCPELEWLTPAATNYVVNASSSFLLDSIDLNWIPLNGVSSVKLTYKKVGIADPDIIVNITDAAVLSSGVYTLTPGVTLHTPLGGFEDENAYVFSITADCGPCGLGNSAHVTVGIDASI